MPIILEGSDKDGRGKPVRKSKGGVCRVMLVQNRKKIIMCKTKMQDAC